MTTFCLATELRTTSWWREERVCLKNCKNLKTIKTSSVVREGVRQGHIDWIYKPLNEGENGLRAWVGVREE